MRPPREIPTTIREALVVLGLAMIVMLYLCYVLDPTVNGLWSRQRSGEWLLLGLSITYSLSLRALGFETEVKRIQTKEVWIHAIGTLAFVLVGIVVVLGIFAILFVSLFPDFWTASAGVLALCGFFWLVQMARRS